MKKVITIKDNVNIYYSIRMQPSLNKDIFLGEDIGCVETIGSVLDVIPCESEKVGFYCVEFPREQKGFINMEYVKEFEYEDFSDAEKEFEYEDFSDAEKEFIAKSIVLTTGLQAPQSMKISVLKKIGKFDEYIHILRFIDEVMEEE